MFRLSMVTFGVIVPALDLKEGRVCVSIIIVPFLCVKLEYIQ